MRSLGMPGYLRFLPRIEAGVGFFERGLRLLANPRDLLVDGDRAFSIADRTQLLDLAFKFGDRFFEVEISAHEVLFLVEALCCHCRPTLEQVEEKGGHPAQQS